ncbi:MAG: lipid-A-disaccharide synthase N-terminal domain-containing protein [Rhodobiaceae bacterium]|nr:lipid-A-disaccharide synthase N-terminal domain-containing protein [Rhodobiaceae bacterium]
MFFMRFLVQWLASEKAGQSVVPTSFWFFSIAGALIVLAYAIYKVDPVFIIGQLMGLGIYSRNLVFIVRNRKATKVQTEETATGD